MKNLRNAIVASVLVTGCGYQALLDKAASRYETDTTANLFLEDADARRFSTDPSEQPQPLTDRLEQVFPAGSASSTLVHYFHSWGGQCLQEPEDQYECSVVAEIFTPYGPSLSSVLRVGYQVDWYGSPLIERYLRISRVPVFAGHITEEDWIRRSEDQQQMINAMRGTAG